MRHHFKQRWGMPKFYTREWNDFQISVKPNDYRSRRIFRWFWYFTGSNINLSVSVKDLTSKNRQLWYEWEWQRRDSQGTREIDESGEKLIEYKQSELYNKDLCVGGEHNFKMRFWLGEKRSEWETMAHFNLLDRDTMSFRSFLGVSTAILVALIGVLIRLGGC